VNRLLAVTAVLVALAGCGSDGTSSAPNEQEANTLAAAFDKTNDAGTSRMTFAATIRAEGKRVDFSGEGVFDYARARGRLAYDMTELGTVDAELAGIGKMAMVFDGPVFYMHLSGLQSELPKGKKWVKIDLRRAGASAGADLGGLSQLSQSPAQQLQYLRAASNEIEERGQERIRGVETTRYRALVDLRKAIELQVEQAPPKFRDAMRKDALKAIEQTGVDEIPLDVWIDAAGLPRRMTLAFDLTAAGESGNLEMTMELFDFGTKVSTSTPPAGQVLDVTAFVDEPQ
jgi:hypothetical protein